MARSIGPEQTNWPAWSCVKTPSDFMAFIDRTVSTTCVSRWDQVIPSAYADGTDCVARAKPLIPNPSPQGRRKLDQPSNQQPLAPMAVFIAAACKRIPLTTPRKADSLAPHLRYGHAFSPLSPESEITKAFFSVND